MAFEVRSALSEFGPGEEKPRIGAFTDDDWRKIFTLAREHGFDPRRGVRRSGVPQAGESRELSLVASQELAVALSEVLRKETSPNGETEGRAWVYAPERGHEIPVHTRCGSARKCTAAAFRSL